MAKIYCKSSYLLRKDTAENWGNKNPVLRKGEQGLETDTGIMKIGDGTTEFNSLSDDNIYLPKSRINKSVDDVKSYVNNNFANALKGNKSDTAMLLDDVSPVTHEMGVKVRGKNLFDASKLQNVTFETYSDIPCFSYYDNANYFIYTDNFIKGAQYTFTTKAYREDGVINKPIYFYLRYTDGTKQLQILNVGEKGSVTSIAGKTLTKITGNDGYGLKCYVDLSVTQIELGTTATDYTPYVPDLTAVKVSRCGKNLFDKSISFTDTNHYVSIGGGYRSFKLYVGIGTAITVSLSKKYTAEDGKLGSLCVYPSQTFDAGGKWLFLQNNAIYNNKEANIISTDGYISLKIDFDAYKSFKDELQIEIGTTATYYEPYITPTDYTPTADGTVNGVTSLYPNTTLMTDTEGVLIDCEYNRDINKAFAELQQAIISLGGNV